MSVVRDTVGDAWRSVARRPWRTWLTVSGVGLGIAALVGILALAESGSLQIMKRFDPLAATEVRLSLRLAVGERGVRDRLSQLPGVLSAGLFADGTNGVPPVSIGSARTLGEREVPLVIASGQGLATARPRVVAGAVPRRTTLSLEPRIAVVGLGVARDLVVGPEEGRNVLLIEGQPFIVTAVVTDRVGARLAGAVIVGPRGGRALGIAPPERAFLVRTRPGSGQFVARMAPLVLAPEDPYAVWAQVPPDPRRLRDRISSDTRTLLLALALVTLAAGAVGIANTMLVAVWERRAEIGVRRALGATGRDIWTLFLSEAAVVGSLGGVLGAAVGVIIAAGLCAAWGWTFVLPPPLVLTPLLGCTVGVVAGILPAIRAARVDPVEALRAL